jgi:hypothetical protein
MDDKLRPFMITNYFLNNFQSQVQNEMNTTMSVTTIHGRLAKVVNDLITYTFKFVTLILKSTIT